MFWIFPSRYEMKSAIKYNIDKYKQESQSMRLNFSAFSWSKETIKFLKTCSIGDNMIGIDSLTQKIYMFMGFSVQIIEIRTFEVLKLIDTILLLHNLMYNKVTTHCYFNKRNVIKLSIVYLRLKTFSFFKNIFFYHN